MIEIGRRTVIKGLAASGFTAFLQSGPSRRELSPRGTPTDDGKLNVLVHGFFFMHFAQQNIYLSTPPFDGHQFRAGVRGLLLPLLSKLDLSQGPLLGGSENDFSRHKEIAQFSSASTGQVIGDSNIQVILPLPDEIIPLRLGSVNDFKPLPSSFIGKSILSNSNGKMALVTCLRYRVSATIPLKSFHLHAQPPFTAGTDHVNAALIAAKSLFPQSDKFDLQMDPTYAPPAVNLDSTPPHGIETDDERGLDEQSRGVQVGNCLQYAVTS